MSAAARQRFTQPATGRNLGYPVGGLKYTVSVGYYESGQVGEIFIQNHKAGSQAGIMASDAAVAASLALQHGASVEVLRHAMMRDPQGRASSPLGVALDQLAAEGALWNSPKSP